MAFLGVAKAVVDGVQIPGTEGRASIASLVIHEPFRTDSELLRMLSIFGWLRSAGLAPCGGRMGPSAHRKNHRPFIK